MNIGNNLSHEQKAELISLSQEFEDIVSDFPGYTNLLEHAIKLTTDKPVTIRQYPIPFAKLAEFDREVKAMLDANVIEYSSSPYRSPMLLVKKSDGTNRPVIDYRMLNRQTVFDAEPISNVDAIFAKLGSANFVSKLDFTKGYWQIPMMHSDKEKTAFSTPMGLMQFRVMPFGLVNAGATYTRMMRHLLQDLPNVDNYIDDVLVYTDYWQEHIASLRALFYRIRDAKLAIKPAKCYLGYYSVSFLGHVIKHGNLHTRQETIDKIVNAPVPKTIKQVRAFLGLSGYYRSFFPKYAEVACPLVDLTKKGQPNVVVWNQQADQAFRKLKEFLCKPPVLRLPDLSRDFILRTDASNVAVGAILLQEYDGMFFPISYASKMLSRSQQAYSTIERESLAIIWAVQKYYQYLYGRQFIIQTDHSPLQYLNSAKLSNSRLMRWAIKLQPFTYSVQAISGSLNIGSDYLSRI